jgi:hypothetical protein
MSLYPAFLARRRGEEAVGQSATGTGLEAIVDTAAPGVREGRRRRP